ncbi:M14 family zinc carboxypeptidase [Robertkochia flava]|uniref:M14 family zinc carboxypeptidase n=1 Tax=Robertkochia flava TaxID=3447986 RepID=UPI001CC9ABD2|nr:M14 family zinc carboxypeptidase [Robertkochia marina]
MRLFTCIAFTLFSVPVLMAQDFTSALYNDYAKFREEQLDKRRIKHQDIKGLIDSVKEDPSIEVNKVGTSIEGRDLYLLSLGEGDTDVFLWSQMHGDESTATMAVFDILNFFQSDTYPTEKETMLKNLRIHFLPMLNPDGAENFTRRNRLGIDINRDALRLQSPESRTLKRVRDSLDADFGFNLHDQSRYYNANRTEKPATVSFLAPAYNYEKDINLVRGNAMKIIVLMNEVLQQFVPGQVGRYNDDFEPRAFGDNIQKWGTSTILIESGGNYADREKQEIRKLNFVSVMTALKAIAERTYETVDKDRYFEIPNNDRKLFDLKLEGLTYNLLGSDYLLDVGFYQYERDNEDHSDFYLATGIGDLGDLSTFYGYKSVDVHGLHYVPAKVYPKVFENLDQAMELDLISLVQGGYGYIRVKAIPDDLSHLDAPVHIIGETYEIDPEIRIGNNPSFFISDDAGNPSYYVINGALFSMKDLRKGVSQNALILR